MGVAQEDWLIKDLTANPTTCTLGYWHHPRYSSGKNHGDHAHMQNLFKILYEHGTDVVIAGHDQSTNASHPKIQMARPTFWESGSSSPARAVRISTRSARLKQTARCGTIPRMVCSSSPFTQRATYGSLLLFPGKSLEIAEQHNVQRRQPQSSGAAVINAEAVQPTRAQAILGGFERKENGLSVWFVHDLDLYCCIKKVELYDAGEAKVTVKRLVAGERLLSLPA